MKSKRSKRLALVLLIFGVIFAILYFAIRAMLPGMAEKYGLTFSAFEFDFPLTLSLNDCAYEHELVSVQADSIHVEFRLIALLKGEISGELVYAQNIVVDLKDVPPDPNDTSEFDISDLITIGFDEICVDNGIYQSYTAQDSMSFEFNQLRASKFQIDDGIFADSLFAISGVSRFAFLDTTGTVEDVEAESGSVMANMFPINCSYLEIDQHKVILRNPNQFHEFADVDIALQGISSENPIDTRVDLIHFVYQDTLEFSSSGDEYFLETSGGMALRDFELVLPGVELNLASASMPSDADSAYAVEFGASSLNTNWIHFFVDSLPIARNETLFFEGILAYQGEQLRFDNFQFEAGEQTEIIATGHIAFSSDTYPFNLSQSSFTTSQSDLKSLFGADLSPLKDQLALSGNVAAEGDLANFDFHTQLALGATNIKTDGHYSTVYEGSVGLGFHISSPRIDPQQILVDFDEELVATNLTCNSEITLTNVYDLIDLSVDLSLGSLSYDSYRLEAPVIEAFFSDTGSELRFRDAHQVENIVLRSPSNLLKARSFDLEGAIAGNLPNLLDFKSNAGTVNMDLRGHFALSDTTLFLELDSDSLVYLAVDSTTYASPFHMTFHQSSTSGYDFLLYKDSTRVAEFEADTTVMTWISAGYPLDTILPRFKGYLSLNLDSSLVQNLSGINAEMALKRFEIESNTDVIDVELTALLLRYEDYQILNLQLDEKIGHNKVIGQLVAEEIHSGFASIETVRFDNDTDAEGIINTKLDFIVSSTQKEVGLGFDFQENAGIKKIILDESVPIVFGDDTWLVEDNTGLILNPKNSIEASRVAIKKNQERIALDYREELVSVDVENLDLSPFASFFLKDTTWHAMASVEATYHADNKEAKWKGVVDNIQLDTVAIGSLHLEGEYRQEMLDAHASIENEKGSVDMHVDGPLEDLAYKIELNHFKLQSLNPVLEIVELPLAVLGNSSGHVLGKVNVFKVESGMLAFENTAITSPDLGVDVFLENESISIDNDELNLEKFTLRDKRGNELVLAGNVSLMDHGKLSLTAITEKFVIESKDKRNEVFWGECAFSTRLQLEGSFDDMLLSGKIRLIENSDLNFKYESTLEENELENEIVFRKKGGVDEEAKVVARERSEKGILKYEVDFDIGKSTAYVLISEASNDFIRLTFSGQVELKSGVGNMPLLYGEVESHDGSIFYDAPMVSDLKLKIIEASALFNGLAEDTKFSFKGRETFRVNLSEIDPSQKGGKVPVDVVAKINNSTASNLDMTFDLESENGQVEGFIESLPMETRNQYAMNLLVFGSLEGTGGSNSVMSAMFAKLNEISRRNIKNADLNFYVDSQVEDEASGSTENVSEIGYNFQTGLYNDKIRLKVGGEFLSGNTTVGRKEFNPLADVELDYVLKRDPDFYITLRKQDSYRGVIDGQVDEYSVGFTYSIQFKNLFTSPKDSIK